MPTISRFLVRARFATTALAVLLVGTLALPSLAQARPTYVSLTFDDGTASQASAVSSMAAHNMRGTFYVNSGDVGSDPYFMDWSEIQAVAAAGHEIGGHTTTHADLTTLTPAQQAEEICGDRAALQARGYDPVSFAYPFAKHDASSRALTQSCGYTSARGVGNVGCLPGCAPAESVPPPDPTLLRTAAGVEDTTSLATLRGYVTNAVQNGGGWVILVFHTFCTGCGDTNSMTAANFDALLDFIQGQAANGVSVRTVREVMAIPPAPPPPNLLRNPSLEDGITSAGPACWTRSSYDGASGGGSIGTWAESSDAHSGANAEHVLITSWVDGDQKLSSGQDLVGASACSPAAIPGHRYQAGAWYKTSVGANVRMVAYYRDGAGAWQFWREQPLPASTTWAHASWQTPLVPAGATALSIGFSLRSAGSATVDDLSLGDLDSDYQAPVSSATSPAYATSRNIAVSYAAADEDGGSGVATVDLYAKAPGESIYVKVDTSVSPSGAFHYVAPAVEGAYGFYAVATDHAGNREATSAGQTTTVVDTVAPVSAASSPATSRSTALTVGYAASDAGLGLATVELYARTPGASVYAKVATDADPASTGSFTYDADAGDGAYAFYAVATDVAGNRGTTATGQTTTVLDTVAPVSAASSPATSTTTALTISYTASDAGTGLATVDLYAKAPGEGAYVKVRTTSSPGASGSFSYTAAAGDGSYGFYTVATDEAGNQEAAPAGADATTIVDTVPPDTVAPHSAATSPAYSTSTAVTVSYTASDSSGSGVATVELWAKAPAASAYAKVATDTTPSAAETFGYTASGGDGSYRFYTVATDRAGNREATTTPQATTVLDTIAPVSAATSPASSLTTALAVGYTASDAGSGLATVELWAKAPAASTFAKVSTDTTPTASESFSYTAAGGDGSYRFYTVATDKAGKREATAAAQATTVVDALVPVSAATSPAFARATALTVTYTASDAGSGLAEVALYAKAPGASAYTKAKTDTTPTASETFSYTASAGNGGYSFYTVATDKVGRRETTSTAQTTTVLDTVVPTAQNIRSDNGSGSDGKADSGDTVTFTFSEAMSPASIVAAWSGASTQVLVKLVDAANSADTLQVGSADNAARLAVANPLALNGDYVPSSGAVFRATMAFNAAGTVLTVTLGTLQSGSVKPASQANAQKNGPLKWTPDARATDRAGNPVNTTALSKSGTAF